MGWASRLWHRRITQGILQRSATRPSQVASPTRQRGTQGVAPILVSLASVRAIVAPSTPQSGRSHGRGLNGSACIRRQPRRFCQHAPPVYNPSALSAASLLRASFKTTALDAVNLIRRRRSADDADGHRFSKKGFGHGVAHHALLSAEIWAICGCSHCFSGAYEGLTA